MPTLLAEAPQIPLRAVPPRKRWTRAECEPLEASGAFAQEKLELIDGELISKRGKNRPHVKAATRMLIWLQQTFGSACVNAAAPIDVSPEDNIWDEPEPDLIVLKRDSDSFDANPQPEDLALVVEVSDSTLKFDLSVKAALYARAGIAEYWVLDVANRRLVVHRGPEAGVYTSVEVYSENETLAPLASPEARLSPADFLSRVLPRKQS